MHILLLSVYKIFLVVFVIYSTDQQCYSWYVRFSTEFECVNSLSKYSSHVAGMLPILKLCLQKCIKYYNNFYNDTFAMRIKDCGLSWMKIVSELVTT